MTVDERLSIVDPDEGNPEDHPRGDARVDGVLLAAGTSTRYGAENKLLETIGGDLVVRHAAGALLEAPLESVTVVVGHESDRVEAALEDLPVDVVRNEGYERGQSTTVRAGVAALPDDADAVVVALGDMPAVAPASVRALVRAYCSGAGSALATAHDGNRGNPVLFERRHFERLRALEGDRGGRAILTAADTDAALVETGDPGVRADLDRPADRERVQELLERRADADS